MSNFWYGSVVMVTLILGPCAPSSSQQPSQSMINNQGVRALIAKNPPGKSDAEYASEINTCEGVSRRQMNDQANAYAGCMLHFGNRPNVGNGVLDNSTPSPQIRDPGIVAGPNPWVPPGPPRQTITPPASASLSRERWRCEQGIEININRSARVAELFSASFGCAIVITDGMIGSVGGNCPSMSGNPLLIYRQFVNLKGPLVEFGYEAYGAGAPHIHALGAGYERYTVDRANGNSWNLSASDGGRNKPSGKCVNE